MGIGATMKVTCSRVAGFVLLLIGIVLAVAGLGFIPLTFILPESFSSTARIKVERDVSDIMPMIERPALGGYDPYFIQTEFEVIQSAKILHTVISNLNLNVVWAKKFGAEGRLRTDETLMLLRRQVDLRPVRNTSLIEIRVYSDKPDEAAVIANEIAEVHQNYRLRQRKNMREGGIVSLKAQYEDQERRVWKIQDEVDELRRALDSSDLNAARTGPTPSLETETLRRYASLRIEVESRNREKDELLDKLQSLARAELRGALPTLYPDPLLNALLKQLNLAERMQVTASKDYSPEHAETVRAEAQVEALQKKVDDRIHAIMLGLQTQAEAARAKLAKLKEEVDKARERVPEKAEPSRPYYTKKRDLETARRFLEVLAMKIASEQTDTALPKTTVVDIVDRAVPGLAPVRPNKPLNIALGIIVGLVVGVGLAFFIEYLDTSVKTIDDVERSLQAPVLGVIPQNVGYLLFEGTESPHAEAYRVLRTNLLFSRKDDKFNTMCVVSAGAGEGKTTTAFNLATVFAQSGQRVLIVDSDLRRPTLHKLMKVANTMGLTSYLLKQNTLEEVIQTTPVPNMDFMPSGKLPSSSLGILSSPQMKNLISELKQRYDFVFFDSPPIMGVSDASVLASEVDLTLQVIQYRRYPQPMNIRAKQLIEKVGGTLIGIVLNNINMSQDESYYYYSGYYHDYYYYRNENEPTDKGGKAADDKSKVEIKPKY